MHDGFPAACLVVLVVLSGCSALGGGGSPTATPSGATPSDTATATPTETPSPTVTPNHPDDPESDVLGWEDGYWYNETLSVSESDGLNGSEFDRVVARTKGRVEVLRDREFTAEKENTTIEFITREQLEEKDLFQFDVFPHRDAFWEATFVVGENETVANELEQLYGVVVDGYAKENEVVLVAENPDSPRVDPATLAHELSHILGGPKISDDVPQDTWDDRHAIRGMKEGTANFVESRYLERCGTQWSCLERPPDASVVENFEANRGLFLWFAAPYTIGDDFVRRVYERGGNDAVDEAYRTVPASMEMFVHPEKYPNDEPTDVDVADRSNDEWEPIETGDADEYGEVILYAALKANGVIGGPEPEINEAQRTGLNYSAPATAGWEGDTFRAYWTELGSREYGYVFASAWESERDARQFREAYLELLRTHGAVNVEGNVYRIDSGPYADAFRVVRDGNRVVVVNAPTVEELDEVRQPE